VKEIRKKSEKKSRHPPQSTRNQDTHQQKSRDKEIKTPTTFAKQTNSNEAEYIHSQSKPGRFSTNHRVWEQFGRYELEMGCM
jgi:hypothetical protein